MSKTKLWSDFEDAIQQGGIPNQVIAKKIGINIRSFYRYSADPESLPEYLHLPVQILTKKINKAIEQNQLPVSVSQVLDDILNKD